MRGLCWYFLGKSTKPFSMLRTLSMPKEGLTRLLECNVLLTYTCRGATRPPPAPPISEAQSYLSLARTLNLIPASSSIGTQTDPLPLSMRITTEEFALDSYQNLLFSIMRFKEVTGRWPGKVTVVGYGMKRRRSVIASLPLSAQYLHSSHSCYFLLAHFGLPLREASLASLKR